MVIKRASDGKADWGSSYIWKPRQGTTWAYPEAKTKKRRAEKGESRKKNALLSPAARRRTASNQALSQAETVVVAEKARFQKITDFKRYQHIWEPEAWGTGRIGRTIAKAL
jgi:hypothetical protein